MEDAALLLLSRTPTFLRPKSVLVWADITTVSSKGDKLFYETILAALPGKSVTFVLSKRFASKLRYSVIDLENLEETFDIVYINKAIINNRDVKRFERLLQDNPNSIYVIRINKMANVIFETLQSNGFHPRFFDRDSQTARIFKDTECDTIIAKMKI